MSGAVGRAAPSGAPVFEAATAAGAADEAATAGGPAGARPGDGESAGTGAAGAGDAGAGAAEPAGAGPTGAGPGTAEAWAAAAAAAPAPTAAAAAPAAPAAGVEAAAGTAGAAAGGTGLCGPALGLSAIFAAGAVFGGRSNAKTRGVYPFLGAVDALVDGVASFSTTVCSTSTGSGPSGFGSVDSLAGTGLVVGAGGVEGAGLLGVPSGTPAPGAVLWGALSAAAGAAAGGTTGGRGAWGASDCSEGVTGWAFSGDLGAG